MDPKKMDPKKKRMIVIGAAAAALLLLLYMRSRGASSSTSSASGTDASSIADQAAAQAAQEQYNNDQALASSSLPYYYGSGDGGSGGGIIDPGTGSSTGSDGSATAPPITINEPSITEPAITINTTPTNSPVANTGQPAATKGAKGGASTISASTIAGFSSLGALGQAKWLQPSAPKLDTGAIAAPFGSNKPPVRAGYTTKGLGGGYWEYVKKK